MTLNLADQGIPSEANEVIIFATLRSGTMNNDREGLFDVTVPDTDNGPITRSIFFRTYNQGSWSFNSEYFTLPIGSSRTVTAQVKTAATGGNFEAAVTVVGYKVPPSHGWPLG